MYREEKPRNRRPIKIGTIVVYFILTFWAITTIFPFIWVLLNSVKPSAEVLNSSFALPKEFTWGNYENAFSQLNVLNAYKHSLLISCSVTIGVMILSAFLSFAISRYDFKGKKILNSLLVASLMFPVFSTIIPVFRMMVSWKLLNTNFAVILPQIAGNLSFATIVMIGFMNSIPIEMEEAAYMEGANVFQVFFRIIVPLCKIMIDDPKRFPISTLLERISSQYGTDFGLMAASVALIIVPVLIVYCFLQKNIIKGLTAGAVKG